jgi:hypothetical protein
VQPRLGVLRGHGEIVIATARSAIRSEASCRSKWSRCLMRSELCFMDIVILQHRLGMPGNKTSLRLEQQKVPSGHMLHIVASDRVA